jgi:vacuolar-type H+-ATPase subunit I/STV1
MDAAFFALAFTAAINPKILGMDLILIETKRPRLMFICFLIGALGLSVSLGVLDVVVWKVDAVHHQGQISATLDIILGVALLAVGGLVATGRVHRPRKAPVATGEAASEPKPKEGWAERLLRDPRPGLVVLVGAVMGSPGASYITGLHELIKSGSSTANQLVGVVLFNLIMFSPAIVPLILLQVTPETTKHKVKAFNHWLGAHARELVAAIALVVGAYCAISGLIRILAI